MTASSPRIGVIGIGLMGHGIAKNIVAKGQSLSFLKRRSAPDAGADLIALGGVELLSPREVAAASDIVILCVTGSPEVEAVCFGSNGIIESARRGLVVIDTSTAEPTSTAALRDRFAQHGVEFVDAPLARTPVEAELGKLNTMVGATDAVFAQIEPVLKAYCENIFHVGPPGAGHKVKLMNNFIAQAICTATAEAFAAAVKSGVDPKQLVRVVSAGGVNSGLFQAMAKSLDGDMQGLKFQLDNARKDLRYYTHFTESMPLASWLGEAVHQALVQACAMGLGDGMVAELVTAQEMASGVQITPAARA
ncbi:NAD(P)-dependent oxidoreductase [Casimicrobium huifangae]|jgi:3-hydroxyisobutyrate dehydrogenase-like beta-hydroxyacid dehydrogenase|uniref:NAD(P)-dependent oxidoreductase n=1 Tax=Casimicrobium huifangae TaxID=2591109 RepID=UPI0037851CB7